MFYFNYTWKIVFIYNSFKELMYKSLKLNIFLASSFLCHIHTHLKVDVFWYFFCTPWLLKTSFLPAYPHDSVDVKLNDNNCDREKEDALGLIFNLLFTEIYIHFICL